MGKITRSRNGCFTCKQRRRKCDEGKPECQNCINSGRRCGGYGVQLVFDVDDSRNVSKRNSTNSKGERKYGFRGRPRMKDSMAAGPMLRINNFTVGPGGPKKVEKKKMAVNNLITKSESGIDETPMTASSSVGDISNDTTLLQPSQNTSTSSIGSKPKSVTEPAIPKGSQQASTTNQQPQQQQQQPKDHDITNPFQFEHALYDGLDYLLESTDLNLFSASTTSGIPAQFQLNPQQQQLLDLIEFSNNGSNIDNNDTGRADNDSKITHPMSPLNFLSPKYMVSSPSMVPTKSTCSKIKTEESNDLNTTQSLILDESPEMIQASSNTETHNNDDEVSNPSSTSIYAPSPRPSFANAPGFSEDNYILRHFFDKLIYLLDAHPQTPWPDLMMRFCSFELAKSCFLSLSSMHLYVNNGENEFYKKGMLHINNTMEYLIKYVKNKDKQQAHTSESGTASKDGTDAKSNKLTGSKSQDGDEGNEQDQEKMPEKGNNDGEGTNNDNGKPISVDRILTNLKNESTTRKQTNFFVILLLIFVHLAFAILESGRTALSRLFLKLFASIVKDHTFNSVLSRIDQSQSLICGLSWWDTISALVSPDCRLPFCNIEWLGTKNDQISTAKMTGCPGEIFAILYDICKLRHVLGGNNTNGEVVKKPECEISEIDLNCTFENLKTRIMNYRDYVPLELPNNSFTYQDRLKAAQCWSISAYVKLLEVTQLDSDYRNEIDKLVLEFLSVYETLNSQSPIVTQMVWPVLNIGINCH
ncbi:unnamed protein product [Ambrosiozyma monospora]|uniref:Unnamed protein product n=1 Tax=Ambrosiozyma monospora TaxID=43982 RepID=A0A9W7DIK2_AMBMO|nr:unnamed protein product [Ambrosiozyma monospora]